MKEQKLSLLNGMTHFCMDKAECRVRNIAKCFEEDQDYTEEAKNLMHRLTNLTVLQSRIKVTDLVLTYMGSKSKAVV